MAGAGPIGHLVADLGLQTRTGRTRRRAPCRSIGWVGCYRVTERVAIQVLGPTMAIEPLAAS